MYELMTENDTDITTREMNRLNSSVETVTTPTMRLSDMQHGREFPRSM